MGPNIPPCPMQWVIRPSKFDVMVVGTCGRPGTEHAHPWIPHTVCVRCAAVLIAMMTTDEGANSG